MITLDLNYVSEGSAPFNRMSIHPSFPLKGALEPISAASRWEVGSILDEAPALRSHACFLPVLGCDLLKVCSFPPFLHAGLRAYD